MGKMCKFYRECRSEAEIVVHYSKLPLCKTHFIKHIERRVERTIRSYGLITRKDRKILVALSGGKDSHCLLTILASLKKNSEYLSTIPFNIEALFIDLGIHKDEYMQKAEEKVRKLCDKLEIPLNIFSTYEAFGLRNDDIALIGKTLYRGKKRHKNRRFRGVCAYCGLIKRYTINYFAYKNGFQKVATGHNLTDEASTLLANFINVDTELMSRAGPKSVSEIEGLVTRIKPLYFIYEYELRKYAEFAEVPYLNRKCVYSGDAPMVKLKKHFEALENDRPGYMMAMLKKFIKKMRPILYDAIPEEMKAVKKCSLCGMPTYLEICAFCRTRSGLLEDLETIQKR